jgi:hypothetical protein
MLRESTKERRFQGVKRVASRLGGEIWAYPLNYKEDEGRLEAPIVENRGLLVESDVKKNPSKNRACEISERRFQSLERDIPTYSIAFVFNICLFAGRLVLLVSGPSSFTRLSVLLDVVERPTRRGFV